MDGRQQHLELYAPPRSRFATSPACTARWGFLPLETSLGAASILSIGRTARETSGCLGAQATMPITGTISMISGSSVQQRTNGCGWVAARSKAELQPGCTAGQEHLPPITNREAEGTVPTGQTRQGTCGFLGGSDLMRTVALAISTTCGSTNYLQASWSAARR
jgi:hypothetical protein